MTLPEVFIENKKLPLIKRIGGGGEGDVYLCDGSNPKAVKIYRPEKRTEREAKVTAMVNLGLSGGTSLIAYPEQIVRASDGRFLGFTMRLFKDYKALHELYGVKSRKNAFPKADFRFLVRTASNLARAVATVHQSACIIGDFNHSGVLVSEAATVALIDADSFQFSDGNKVFPCVVGVPDFTAPELHGMSLARVTRTREHDQFALAVAIFQLLFMGRHPYSGRQIKGDLELKDLIARNMFAYSRLRDTGMSPPPGAAILEDFPEPISSAFERAFGIIPSTRPMASEWVQLLNNLESKLTNCSANALHYYPSTSKQCPWCRIESTSGAILFVSPIILGAIDDEGAVIGGVVFDFDNALKSVQAIEFPNIEQLVPKFNFSTLKPSTKAIQKQKEQKSRKIIGPILALAVVVGGLLLVPNMFLFWVPVAIFLWSKYGGDTLNGKEFLSEYSAICDYLDGLLKEHIEKSGVGRLYEMRGALERAAADYKWYSEKKAKDIKNLSVERYNRQLNSYLDQYLLRRASVSGIGPAKTATLISFGIETAADITKSAIIKIPGFGDATAEKLLSWRKEHERGFVYNPAPLPSDIQEQRRIEADFANKARSLANQLVSGRLELSQAVSTAKARLSVEDAKIKELSLKKAQLEADIKFLGLSLPYRSGGASSYTTSTSYKTSTPAHVPTQTPSTQTSTQTSSTPTCPQCGARMIRRTAKRGARRGKQFWGCSRYPLCKGTKN